MSSLACPQCGGPKYRTSEKCGKCAGNATASRLIPMEDRHCSGCGGEWAALVRVGRKIEGKACLCCGAHFHPRRLVASDPGDKGLYCSRKCGAMHLGGRMEKWTPDFIIYGKACGVCGKWFYARQSNTRLCSDECVRSEARRDWAEHYQPVPPVEHECVECGCAFMGPHGAQYCSPRCMRRVHKGNRKAKARECATFRDDIPHFKDVWDKSNGKCHICGEHARRDTPDGHPLGATIDHVIPLSMRGDHSLGNARIAHRCCNSAKGNRWTVSDGLRAYCRSLVEHWQSVGDAWAPGMRAPALIQKSGNATSKTERPAPSPAPPLADRVAWLRVRLAGLGYTPAAQAAQRVG